MTVTLNPPYTECVSPELCSGPAHEAFSQGTVDSWPTVMHTGLCQALLSLELLCVSTV